MIRFLKKVLNKKSKAKEERDVIEDRDVIEERDVKEEDKVQEKICKDSGKLNILITDDAKINRYILSRFLEKMLVDTQIDECENGLLALERVKETDYDIIFLDIKMPKLNGDKVAIKLKEDGSKSILIGVTGQIEVINYLLEIGMSYCLEKPLNLNELKKCVKLFISTKYYKDGALS